MTRRRCRRVWNGWTSRPAPAAATAGSIAPTRAARPAGRCWPTTRTWRSRCRRSGTRCTSWPPASTSPASRCRRRPSSIIGHNARLAWGLTNTGIDVQDFYVEDVDMTRRQYLYRGQWLPLHLDHGRDRRARPGAADRLRDLQHPPRPARSTPRPSGRRRPTWPRLTGRVTPRPLALRWETRGETAGGFEAINRAANWTEFLAGVRRFAAPSQNFVYADVDGHIGYAMSGRVPAAHAAATAARRREAGPAKQDWVGIVAGRDGCRRSSIRPSGQIVTANARDRPPLARRDDARLDRAVSDDADRRTAARAGPRSIRRRCPAIQIDVQSARGRSDPCRRRGRGQVAALRQGRRRRARRHRPAAAVGSARSTAGRS